MGSVYLASMGVLQRVKCKQIPKDLEQLFYESNFNFSWLLAKLQLDLLPPPVHLRGTCESSLIQNPQIPAVTRKRESLSLRVEKDENCETTKQHSWKRGNNGKSLQWLVKIKVSLSRSACSSVFLSCCFSLQNDENLWKREKEEILNRPSRICEKSEREKRITNPCDGK